MCKLVINLAAIFFAMIFSTAILAKEPLNLYYAKQAVVKYYTSGEYHKDVNAVVAQAHAYAKRRIEQRQQHVGAPVKPRQLAAVFDIDDTVLSSYLLAKKLSFGGTPQDILRGQLKMLDTPILSVLGLYNYLLSNKVAIFFVTGRREVERNVTVKNLQKAGFHHWQALYMKPNNYQKQSVIPYKSTTREKIEQGSYDIILNMGDQYSDLQGGYADRDFKLPNPMYFLP